MPMSSYALIPSEGRVSLETENVSAPPSDSLLLKAHYSSVSQGTETSLMAGHILPLPQRLGYSIVAEVVEVGTDVEGFSVGDFVAATGTHASYLIANARAVVRIPNTVDLKQAAFFNLAHTALYAVRRSQLQLGESCLVMGQGLVGAITAQLAKIVGAIPVVVSDLDFNRLKISEHCGIKHCLNAGSQIQELENIASSSSSGGFDVIFEATGQREPLKSAFDLVGERGRVVMMSQSQGDTLPNFSHEMFVKSASLIGGYINSKPFKLYRSDIEIRDTWPPVESEGVSEYGGKDIWTSQADIETLMHLIESGDLNLRPLITHEYSWEDIPELYQQVWERDAKQLGVIIDWTNNA